MKKSAERKKGGIYYTPPEFTDFITMRTVMVPLAKAAGFKPSVHKWNQAERDELQAEVDAAYFILYGIEKKSVEYILSTFSGIKNEHENLLTGTSSLDRIVTHYNILRKAMSK